MRPYSSAVALALSLLAGPARADDGPDWDRLDASATRARAEAEEAARPKVSVRGDDAPARLRALEAAARARPRDVDARFALARHLHLLGVDGDEEAHDRALELLEAVAAERPGPRADAWLGSARLLQARYTLAFWNKGDLVKEGLALLDRAVKAAPEDVEVRWMRGVGSYHLPFFFDRGDRAADDLAWVAARVAAAVDAGALSPEVAAAALFLHGVCRHDRGGLGEAQTAWRQAVALAPASAHGRAAAARLARR
jgi:tetratricopeptide (TPR) repeat protein